MNALEGRTAIIVGGAGGAGSGFARYFASQGAEVLVNDTGYHMLPGSGDYDINSKNQQEADEIAASIRNAGGTAESDFEDASDAAAARRIITHCLDTFGKIDIIVHASNVSRLGRIETLSDDDWELVIKQNLNPVFYLTRDALPYMKRQRFGRHIFLGSATIRDMWGGANYAAASGGIYSFMRSVALEYMDCGITANSIEPWTQTKTGLRPSGQQMLRDRQIALGLPEQPPEPLPPGDTNAPLGAYLCTQEGKRFNGQYFSSRFGRICLLSTPTELRYLYKDIERDGYWTVEELIKEMPAAFDDAVQPLWHPRV